MAIVLQRTKSANNEKQNKSMIINAINYYKKEGMLNFLRHLLDRLGFKFFTRSLIFVVLDLTSFPNDVNKPYSFTIATRDDVQNEQDYDDFWFGKEQAIERIQNGNQLLTIKINHKMACFQWIEFEKAAIAWFDLKMHLPIDIVYDTGSYTLPEFRNKGITYNFKKEVFHYLKERGYKRVFGVINPSNSASLHMNKKLGFKEYQIVYYKRYWFIKYVRVAKYKSSEQETLISIFRTPEIIWKIFI